MPEIFDCIVVGAGAAGCVLASRLSEDPARSVLLIEAGVDTPPQAEPADVRDTYPSSYFNRAYFWPGLQAHWRGAGNSARTGFPQGRIMGGGGAVMGMIALRGVPNDYAEWEASAGAEWGWEGVLPYFRKLENDCDFDGAMHGADGPIPVRRHPPADWPPLARAVQGYAQSQGLPLVADMNADFRDGYGSVPMSNTGAARASSASCYLDAKVRGRKNLGILTAATVTRIVIEGGRAGGVEVLRAGLTETIKARTVVLAAGAIFSPTLLLRSGIGPGPALQALGIPVVADRPGVGAQLQNHPVVYLGMHLRRHARQPAAIRPTAASCFRYSSGLPGGTPGDMYINLQSKTSWNALGAQIGNISPVLLRPHSRGQVRLATPDARDYPQVEFNFLSDERDLRRLMDGFVRAAAIAGYCAAQQLCGTPFAVRFGDRLRQLNERNRANALKTSFLAGLLGIMPGLSDVVLGRLTGKRVDLAGLAADEAALAGHVLANVAGLFHPAGSCRMGPADDSGAVVDARGRVIGVPGLRVADASVMPNLTSGNTNIPTLMVAEKMADAIIADTRNSGA